MEKIGKQEKVGKIVSTIKTMGNSGNNDRIILMRVFFTDSGNNGRIYKVCMRLARLEQLSRYINILEMESIKVI